MFKWIYAVLVVFAVIIMTFPSCAFSAEKTDKDAVLDEIGNAIDKNPDIIKGVIFSIADDYSRQNKIAEATALYEKALKVMPKAEDLMGRLADLYNRKPDYAKAAELYKRMTELNPDNMWNFQMLSSAYKNAGQKDKAAGVWENLTKSSNKAETYMQAANFYSGENDTEKAIAAVKKAVELAPDNTGYLQSLEGFYIRANNFTEAEAICNKVSASASTKEPWSKDWADMELINIYQKQNKLADLSARFEKDLAQSGKDIAKYRRLAELYQRSNEPDKATAVYEKAIAAGMDDRDTNNRLMDLYERLNKFDKAEAELKKIMAMAPQENYLYERLANLLDRAGKRDDAKKTWTELLAKTPNETGAITRYGDKLNEWGDTDGAVAQYRKAQSIDVKNVWYSMRIADIYSGKGNYDAAKKELNGIIAKTTDTMMKQEAERRIKNIDAKSSAPAAAKLAPASAPAAVAVPAQAVAKPAPIVSSVPLKKGK